MTDYTKLSALELDKLICQRLLAGADALLFSPSTSGDGMLLTIDAMRKLGWCWTGEDWRARGMPEDEHPICHFNHGDDAVFPDTVRAEAPSLPRATALAALMALDEEEA